MATTEACVASRPGTNRTPAWHRRNCFQQGTHCVLCCVVSGLGEDTHTYIWIKKGSGAFKWRCIDPILCQRKKDTTLNGKTREQTEAKKARPLSREERESDDCHLTRCKSDRHLHRPKWQSSPSLSPWQRARGRGLRFESPPATPPPSFPPPNPNPTQHANLHWKVRFESKVLGQKDENGGLCVLFKIIVLRPLAIIQQHFYSTTH